MPGSRCWLRCTRPSKVPASELRPFTPRIEAVQIPRDKIGEIIGPKGKMIREIEEETGATLDIDDDGTIRVGAADQESMEAAKNKVMMIAFPPEAELGKEYEGEVVNITKFGAFVNILPGRDGLLHISKIGGNRRIDNVEDVLSLGDKIQVVVGEIDRNGKVSLNMAGEPPSDGGGGGVTTTVVIAVVTVTVVTVVAVTAIVVIVTVVVVTAIGADAPRAVTGRTSVMVATVPAVAVPARTRPPITGVTPATPAPPAARPPASRTSSRKASTASSRLATWLDAAPGRLRTSGACVLT